VPVDGGGAVLQPVNFLSTCAMVLSSERQNGMNPSRILCASRRRGDSRQALVVNAGDRPIDFPEDLCTISLPLDLTLAIAVTASTSPAAAAALPALLVVLLDARDLVEKLALQGRVALQIARDHRAEALEFALDALTTSWRPCASRTALLR